MLVFTDPSCGPCQALLPDLAQWQKDHSRHITVAVITSAGDEAKLSAFDAHDPANVLLQPDDDVSRSYGYLGTPSAVIVGTDGLVATHLVAGADPIRALFASALSHVTRASAVPAPNPNGDHAHHHPHPSPIPAGYPAPGFHLPDSRGATVELGDFLGSDVLVVFWDPRCGFCVQLLPELRVCEADVARSKTKLLLVSTGSVEEIAALRLESPVVLDVDSRVARSFGATGTPMAVLVDADGNIASELGTGRAGLLALVERATGSRPQPATEGQDHEGGSSLLDGDVVRVLAGGTRHG